jgi:hypothetical protein
MEVKRVGIRFGKSPMLNFFGKLDEEFFLLLKSVIKVLLIINKCF